MVLPLIARGVAALGSQALKQGAKQLLKSGAKEAAKGAAKSTAKGAAKKSTAKVAKPVEAKPAKTNKRGTNSRRSDGRFGPAPINSTYTPKPTTRQKAVGMAREALPIAGAAATAGAAAKATSDFMNTRGVNAGSVRSGQYARDKAAKPSAPAKSSAPAAPAKSSLTAGQRAKIDSAASDLMKPGPSSAKDYKSYAKSSDVAADFRRNFAAARKAGEKEFTWQGRKYSTKTK